MVNRELWDGPAGRCHPVLAAIRWFWARRDPCSSRFRCAEGAGARRSGGASHGVGVEVVGED